MRADYFGRSDADVGRAQEAAYERTDGTFAMFVVEVFRHAPLGEAKGDIYVMDEAALAKYRDDDEHDIVHVLDQYGMEAEDYARYQDEQNGATT